MNRHAREGLRDSTQVFVDRYQCQIVQHSSFPRTRESSLGEALELLDCRFRGNDAELTKSKDTCVES
jgi:hypothetical protein